MDIENLQVAIEPCHIITLFPLKHQIKILLPFTPVLSFYVLIHRYNYFFVISSGTSRQLEPYYVRGCFSCPVRD